jgi:opacity protein-like surface antigen
MRSKLYSSFLVAGLLLCCPEAFGQSKFSVSATVAPFYAKSKSDGVVMLPVDDGSGGYISHNWKVENSSNGYWVGLNGRYSFTEKWSASTGLWFSNSRSKTSAASGRSRNFSMPFMANFRSSERPLSPYFSAGALWNFSTTTHIKIPDFGTVIDKSGDNTSRISPLVGAGVIYHFASRLSLIAQPTFSYTIPATDMQASTYQLAMHVQLMLKL